MQEEEALNKKSRIFLKTRWFNCLKTNTTNDNAYADVRWLKNCPCSYLRGGFTLWQWDGCEFKETGWDEGTLYSSSSSSTGSLVSSEREFANGPVHLPEGKKKKSSLV